MASTRRGVETFAHFAARTQLQPLVDLGGVLDDSFRGEYSILTVTGHVTKQRRQIFRFVAARTLMTALVIAMFVNHVVELGLRQAALHWPPLVIVWRAAAARRLHTGCSTVVVIGSGRVVSVCIANVCGVVVVVVPLGVVVVVIIVVIVVVVVVVVVIVVVVVVVVIVVVVVVVVVFVSVRGL